MKFYVRCSCGEKECRETLIVFQSYQEALDHVFNRNEFDQEIMNEKGEVVLTYEAR